MSIDYGFVYFLGNRSMPDMYKIGFTTKHPRARMAELSSASGCPTPFTLLAYFGATEPQRVESSLHRYFANRRVNGNREFFYLELSEIARAVDHYSARFDDVVFRSTSILVDPDAVDEPAPVVVAEPEITEARRQLARAALDGIKATLRAPCK